MNYCQKIGAYIKNEKLLFIMDNSGVVEKF